MDTNICRFQLFCNFVTIPLIIEGDNLKKGMVNVGNSNSLQMWLILLQYLNDQNEEL